MLKNPYLWLLTSFIIGCVLLVIDGPPADTFTDYAGLILTAGVCGLFALYKVVSMIYFSMRNKK